MKKLLLLLLLLPTIVFAQGTATRLRSGSSLPTACGNGDVFYKTTSPIGTHECSVPGNPGTWRQVYGASTGAGGSDTEVQYNCSGSFCGNSQLTYDATNHILQLGNGTSRATIDILGAAGAPSNPSGSRCRIYFNTTSGLVEFVNSSGANCGPSGGTLPANTTSTSHQWFSAYDSSTGAFTKTQPAESDLSVTDITTNNASTSAHGFLNKLDNNAAHYMDGTGAWSTPAGGGGGSLVLLNTLTASSSATLVDTTSFTSTYDEYVIELIQLLPQTGNTNLLMRVSTNGGSSYDSGGNYNYSGFRASNGGSAAAGSTTATAFGIDALGGVASTSSVGGVSGTLHWFNPLGGALYPRLTGHVGYVDNANAPITTQMSGLHSSVTACNAVQFLYSSGNIVSGIIRIYGVAK